MSIGLFEGGTLLVAALLGLMAPQATPPGVDDPAVIRRYLDAVEKNPRRGTGLDRVYGLHVERGKLDELIEGYRARTLKNPKDPAAWMVLGLLEAHRGRDGAAVPAFREAERVRPLDPMASFYLGQALVLIGQPGQAVEAFERAIARKPTNRNDLLDIYQALGRVHQREQRVDQALAVWKRLEAQFPDEPRVRERIAAALVEDGQLAQALERYQLLADDGRDRLRQPLYRGTVAELKAKLNRRDEALVELERLVDDLPPGEWLQRDARRRLEDLFLSTEDVAGLVGFYEKRLTRQPDDLASLVRLAHFLQAQGRNPEARRRLEEASKLSPGDLGLRKELAALLADQQDFQAAATQFEAIQKLEPGNPDTLRQWGWLTLRAGGRPELDRRKDAATIWRRLLPGPGRKPDASITEQVADLFRQAGMTDEALALYRQAVEIAPDSPGPRTHLGEVLQSLGRRDEARATWRGIAAEPNRNGRTLRLLADILADFDDRDEAIVVLEEARRLDPADLGLVLRQADLLSRSSRFPEVLKVLEAASKLAETPEQAEDVLTRQVEAEVSGGTLASRSEALRVELDSGRSTGFASWYRLARYREAARQWPSAELAIRKALESPGGAAQVGVWAASSRIAEASGRLVEAADALRKVADLDRKGRAEHLKQVAGLETRIGRRDQALAAGRELLAASPNDPSSYRFHARICLKFDARDEAIDALRVAVRVDPNDPTALANLAEALVEAGRPDEAIELNWRAFSRTDDPTSKRVLVAVLARLYLKVNQFDRLTERLERLRREADRDLELRRVLTLCLAEAYQSIGELGTARSELERLQADRPDDVGLVQQLVGLAEKEGDLTAALRFQRQVAKLAPRDSQDHLVGLLLQAGEVEEAMLLWEHEAATAQGARRLLELTDNLLFYGQADRALPTIVRVLRDHPRDWEGLYREGVALASLKRPEEAAQRFRAILDLPLLDEQLSSLIAPTSGLEGLGASTLNVPDRDAERAFFDRIEAIPFLLEATGQVAPSKPRKGLWTPGDFGQARMAALVWLQTLSKKSKMTTSFLDGLRALRLDPSVTPRGWWDWFYLKAASSDLAGCKEAATALVKLGEPEAHWAYLAYLGGVDETPVAGSTSASVKPPSAVELDQALISFRALRARRPDWIMGDLENPELPSDVVNPLLNGLKRAGRLGEEAAVLREAVSVAATVPQVVSLMKLAGDRGDTESLLRLFARLDGRSWALGGSQGYPYYQVPRVYPAEPISLAFMSAIDARAEANRFDEVARLIEAFLDANRRRTQAARAMARGATPPPLTPLGARPFLVGTYRRTIDMSFPAPGGFLDEDALMTMADAFMLYERAELLGDLFAQVRARLARSTGTDRSHEYLVLSGLHWWTGERAESLGELTLAVEASPNDPTLRLELARMHETLRQPAEALAVIDALPAPDHAAVLYRESAALRVAVRSGNLERVRLAADRLFPLRIDPATAAEISGQMRQIALHDRAAILLERARGQTGGNPVALSALMSQYQVQNRPAEAADLAHQILRLTRVAVPPSPGTFSRDTDENQEARKEALACLASTGKLLALIARLEAQSQARPRSLALLDGLHEVYGVAEDKKKLDEVVERKLRLRPDDASLRFRLALSIASNSGGADPRAVELFTEALRADLSLYARAGSNEVIPAYQKQGKLADLVALLEQDDSDFANPYAVGQVLSLTLPDPKLRDPSVRLIRATMRKPSYVPGSLVGRLLGDLSPQFLKLDEAESILLDEMIPRPGSTLDDLWSGLTSSASTILDWAAGRGRLGAMADEVGRVAQARPEWLGGRGLLALIDLRRGRTDRARETLAPMFEAKDSSTTLSVEARRAMIGPLAAAPDLIDLATRLAEAGATLEASAGASKAGSYRFGEDDQSMTKALLELYQKTGRTSEARALASNSFRAAFPRSHANDYRTLRNFDREASRLVRYLLKIDAPLDALRMAIKTRDRLGQDYASNQLPGLLETARKAVKAAPTGEILGGLVVEGAEVGSAVDLTLDVSPARLDQVGLSSMLDDAIRSAASADPPSLTRLLDRLGRLRLRDPKNLEVALAEALASLAGPGDRVEALDRLARIVEARPLEEVPSGGRVSSRQRSEASAQVPLWLAARACLAKSETRGVGERLGERALAASTRQLEPTASLAILSEWGRIDRERGDVPAARARWLTMITLLDDQARLKPSSGLAGASKPGAAPLLPDHCRQVLEVATLAARQGDLDLSLKATFEALRNGPPAAAAAQAQFTYSRGDSEEMEVAGRLVGLDALWRERRAPAESVYRTLLGVVLPESRPEEVFPYTVSLATFESEQGTSSSRTRSAGLILGEWATRAGRLDELVLAIEARRPKALAEVPARVILADVGRVRGETRLTLEQLEWFDRRLEHDAGTFATTYCAHVAMTALDRPETRDRAIGLLAHTIRAANAMNVKPDWLASIRRQLAQAQLEQLDQTEGRATLDSTLQVEAPRFSPGASYLLSLQQGAMRQAIATSIAAGRAEPAWDLLGRLVDSDQNTITQSGISFELGWLFDHLTARAASERFDFLKRWIIPADPKKPLRLVILGEPTLAPGGGRPSNGRSTLNTFGMLIDAARDSGRLGELAEIIEPTALAGREQAETLKLMVAIARGQASAIAPKVKERLARLTDRLKAAEGKPYPASAESSLEDWGDALLALACLDDRELRGSGRELADRLTSAPVSGLSTSMLGRLRVGSSTSKLAERLRVDRPEADLGLRYWRTEESLRPGGPLEGWVGAEGHLMLIPGSSPRPLRLAFGLKGPFEFRAEVSTGGLIGFEGRSFARIAPVVSAKFGTLPPRPRVVTPETVEFHAYRLASDSEKVRCWIDGRLVYELDDPAREFPWLTLGPDDSSEDPVVFRNMSLSGNPEWLREIPLSEGKELRWSTTPAEPLGRSGAKNPLTPSVDERYVEYMPSTVEAAPAWSLKDGLISGLMPAETPGPSRLTYARSLREGDSVRYEFRNEPGTLMVHPTFGARVFLIEPGGITTKVLDPGGAMAMEPVSNTPKLGPIRLKPDDWNAVALTIRGGSVELELNGEVVASRAIDPEDSRRFGLIHWPDRTAARVRSVKLILGGRPVELGGSPDLAALEKAEPGPEEKRVVHALVGEGLLRRNTRPVLAKARDLPPLARYETLRAWVFPAFEGVEPRVEGDLAAPSTGGVGSTVPAAELVEAARVVAKLDDLERLGGKEGPERDAIEALIGLARGKDATVSTALARLRSRLERVPTEGRKPGWPEYVAANSASRRPSTRLEASRLLDASVARLDPDLDATPFNLQVRRAAEVARLPEPLVGETRLASWLPSTRPGPRSQRPGFPIPVWTALDGEIRHQPGRGDDLLTFASPLRGDFEFRCELAIDPARAVRVDYSGLGVEVAADGKTFRVVSAQSPSWTGPIDPPIDPAPAWHAYRLTVHAGRAEISLDGRSILDSRVPAGLDPWLVVHSPAFAVGSIRNPTLTGRPEIPDHLDLALGSTLGDWSSDAFGLANDASEPEWWKVGPQVVGRASRLKLGRGQESLLQYLRPLTGRDVLEYEFESVPGRVAVHPALDHLAFLIEGDGVRARRLGDDGESSTETGVEEAGCRRGPERLPLRVGQWNRVAVALDGDTLTLRLNEVEVYQRALDSTNRRLFGFFHESDRTEAHVRAIRLRGSWPGTLPETLTAPAPISSPGPR